MTQYLLPYGKTFQTINIDSGSSDLILPNLVESAPDPAQVINDALTNPLNFDQRSLRNVKSVAIAVNDKTRPVPHEDILPPLMAWLSRQGISRESIKFWIATGSHLPMPAEEYRRILPDQICSNYAIESHNIDDLNNLVSLGTTSRGTPIQVNRQYYQSDLKIVVGDIEPHHFAGFSGGYKTAAIGLAGRDTINANHAMLKDPNAWIAVYDENPLRQDIEEMGVKVGVHFALNTILTHHKKVISAVAGNPLAVMKAGIPLSKTVCGTYCSRKYDVVFASAGGSPKDINFYQAQKALTHASLFANPGGTLVLIAECTEGSGSASYEQFMQGLTSVQEVFSKFAQVGFKVGPHKAFQVARLLSQYKIMLVSNIPAPKVRDLLMTPAGSAQEALEIATADRPASCNIAVVPHATTTLPSFTLPA
jgi:lactate racemase